MALSEKDISAIRRTWAAAAALPDLAGQLFYGHLFRIAPETKPLFRNDMASQAKKLVATIAFVVDHLDNSSSLFPAAADLAVRHVQYGVKPEQYRPVGEALLWALGQLLGDGFGPEERDAWTRAYGVLSEHMIRSVYPAPSEG